MMNSGRFRVTILDCMANQRAVLSRVLVPSVLSGCQLSSLGHVLNAKCDNDISP